jgi:HAD superfamily hydrolase (TIGR01490 family)
MSKRFAVFDIDGTLYRWQLYHELVQELAFAGVFPQTAFHELNERWNKWRGGAMPFDDYERFVVQTMMKNLPLIPLTTFEAACDKVVEQSQHKTHHFPRQLLKELKSKDYTIIAITGSQQELIERFGAHYGFDIVVGAIFERKDGRFTGTIERPTIGKKPDILKELAAEQHLTWEDSYAIGDSDGDASLLELVEHPIAFNPSAGLLARAKKDGWPVVVERKNVAYRLEKSRDAFVLAETIVY